MEKYNQFLNEGKNKDFYRFVNNDIYIETDVIIETLKKEYNLSCWFLYNGKDSVSLQYYQTSDDSSKNIKKIKKFLFDKLPYFRDIQCYDDDRRLVLMFVDVGNPVKFKFNH